MLSRGRKAAIQIECSSNLKAIHLATVDYVNDHSGHYPPDLGVLVAAGEIEPKHLVCPAANSASGVDYVYLAPPSSPAAGHGRPEQEIIACDFEVNHSGQGRSVLFRDGPTEFIGDEADFQALLASPQNAAFAAALLAAEGP